MTPTKFLYCKVTVFPFVINEYFFQEVLGIYSDSYQTFNFFILFTLIRIFGLLVYSVGYNLLPSLFILMLKSPLIWPVTVFSFSHVPIPLHRVGQKEVYSCEYTKLGLCLYYYLLIVVLLFIQTTVNLFLSWPLCSSLYAQWKNASLKVQE